MLLETLDINVSHSCACMWIAMAIVCAWVGRFLYVRVSGGFISARARVWSLPSLLTTMGMIWTWSRVLLCLMIACLRGSYMLFMLLMVSSVLLYVEYLHSMLCMHILPLYERSAASCPWEFLIYFIALTMPGVRCCGLLCLGSMLVGMIVGCYVVGLSFCRPSCVP